MCVVVVVVDVANVAMCVVVVVVDAVDVVDGFVVVVVYLKRLRIVLRCVNCCC